MVIVLHQRLTLSLIILIIILLQFVSIATCKTVELTCPIPTASISRRRLSSTKQSSQSLDSSCFELNITVNVENILPDPTYILPEDNINAISDGIMRTIDDCDISIQSNETDKTWIIDDKCGQSFPHTHKQFATTQFNTSCDEDTLLFDDTTGTISCQLTLPESIVYVWNLKQINLHIDIDFCSEIIMQARIYYRNETIPGKTENVITVSEYVSVEETDTKYEFVFDPTNNTLRQNTTYYVKFEVIQVLGKYDTLNDKFEYENVYCDTIITISQPSSCSLGANIAVTKEIIFGLESLCNESLATPQREHFEQLLFQNHSSQAYIPTDIWDSLETRRRRLLTSRGGGTGGETNSLVITFADGRYQTIAPHEIFPSVFQCVAFDADTRRFFGVGGNDENGNALDRLAIYYLEGQTNLIELDNPNLKLDKPRAMTSCYYYKRNDKEYIISVSGMNHTKYANDSDCWYNDVVFIPLDDNKDCSFPIIKLKFNVIDPKPFVTENDILYIIGGRNSQNATNVIQIIDLNQVFDTDDAKSSHSTKNNNEKNNKKFDGKNHKKPHDVRTLTTFERMEPMRLSRVLPMADFSFIINETCMVTWNGQNYINGRYVSINDSMTQLEMYCNKLLVGYFNTTRPTLVGESTDIQFTDYDNNNLVIPNNDEMTDNNIIRKDSASVRHYDFENDGLWYKFWTVFEICFDDRDEMQNKINFFSDINLLNREILEENILIESQKNYRDWSYGFGAVDICNIDVTEPPCNTEDSKKNNDKNVKRTRKYKSMVPGMLDIEKDYNANTPRDGYNMMMNIIAVVLCVLLLVWISLACCWTKYWDKRKHKFNKIQIV